MDWWSELWLNEGFATWVGWLAVDHLYPGLFPEELACHCFRLLISESTEWNVWGQFVVRQRSKGTPCPEHGPLLTGVLSAE